MNWSDERYVRVYTRDTTDWLLWSWQARALFLFLLRKVDRAGVLDLGSAGARAIAAHTGMPWELAEPALIELVNVKAITLGLALVIPNFMEAQETPQSDRLRAAEYRARRRDIASAAETVTERDESSRPVTEPSRGVTHRHAPSLRAVPDCADPEDLLSASADASQLVLVQPQRVEVPMRVKARQELTAYLEWFNRQFQRRYGVRDLYVKHVQACLTRGYSQRDLRIVAALCHDDWSTDVKMAKYVRPSTLLQPSTVDKYIDDARNAYPEDGNAA